MTSERNIWAGLALLLVLGCGDDDAVGQDAGEHDATITNAANNPFPCLSPSPSSDWGLGYFECGNGLIVRPQPITCPASRVPDLDECDSDSDCGGGSCRCAPGASGNNQCRGGAEGDCRSDHDCTPGFHCAHVIIGFSDWAIYHMRCQQPTDECASAEQCNAGQDAGVHSMSYLACQADNAGRFCCDRATGCND